MDLAVADSVDDVLAVLGLEGVAVGISHGRGCAGEVRQVAVVPALVPKELVDVAVTASVDDVLAVLGLEGVAVGISHGGWRRRVGLTGDLRQVTVVPAALVPKELVDVAVTA